MQVTGLKDKNTTFLLVVQKLKHLQSRNLIQSKNSGNTDQRKTLPSGHAKEQRETQMINTHEIIKGETHGWKL